jgi:serine/threonine protein kinase
MVFSHRRTGSNGLRKETLISRHATYESLSQHYEEVRELGAGNFGRVNLVREISTGLERVCKIMSTARRTSKEVELMKREMEVLASLDHPHVVKLYEYAEDVARQELILILEYIPGGCCDGLLKRQSGRLAESLVARLLNQLLVALAYCHSSGVIHRDVKPENMMLTSPGFLRNPDCKLIDFGLASSPGHATTNDCVGTPGYIAPEVVRFMPPTASADIWSVGITCLELLLGFRVFDPSGHLPSDQIFDAVKRYSRFEDLKLDAVPAWQQCSDEAQDFVQWLLEVDPRQRPTAAEALEHSWLAMYKPEAQKLTSAMAQSLVSYTSASSASRCMQLIIAARLGVQDQDDFGAVFLGADMDGDGRMSRDEISYALDDVNRWWWDPAVNLDADSVLRASEMEGDEGMCYTEFVAACLFSKHSSLEHLAQQAFYALDVRRDGYVHVQHIHTFFDQRDWPLLQSLPQHRAFTEKEWVSCVQRYAGKAPLTSRRVTC